MYSWPRSRDLEAGHAQKVLWCTLDHALARSYLDSPESTLYLELGTLSHAFTVDVEVWTLNQGIPRKSQVYSGPWIRDIEEGQIDRTLYPQWTLR